MTTQVKITNAVKVSVSPTYDRKNSHPSGGHFVFRYDISIENLRNNTIKLLHRKWKIYDSAQGYSEIAGVGVIGMQPEINTGGIFSYFSNVALVSGLGYMSGVFIILDEENQREFEIEIPKFHLMAEILCN